MPIPNKEIKLTEIFILTPLCGASKGFVVPFQAPQGSVKKKLRLLFDLTEFSERSGVGRVKK